MSPLRKIVVTGGAGFIGSYIAEAAAEKEYRTVILDDLSSGKRDNIEPLLGNPRVDFVEGSIADLPLLRQLFKDAAYVFHLAAVASVPRSIDDPLGSHRINADGTLNVLQAARECGVAKVVYSSSSAVYGDTEALPIREDTPPRPLSPYAVDKLTSEQYCDLFSSLYRLSTISLRYFNVFGPRQDPASEYAAVIPAFFREARLGKPLMIYGDGTQTRDFIHVQDVVAANYLAAESDVPGSFNIGSGEATTIRDLARAISRIVPGYTGAIENTAPRPGDILHSVADINKAGLFGFRKRITLEEGLKNILAFHQP